MSEKAASRRDPVLKRVIETQGQDGITALARKLKISQAAVSQWTRVPHNRVIEIEKITGISRHDLRPDLYPKEEGAAA